MNAQQRALVDAMRAGPRGKIEVRGPFAAFIHALIGWAVSSSIYHTQSFKGASLTTRSFYFASDFWRISVLDECQFR